MLIWNRTSSAMRGFMSWRQSFLNFAFIWRLPLLRNIWAAIVRCWQAAVTCHPPPHFRADDDFYWGSYYAEGQRYIIKCTISSARFGFLRIQAVWFIIDSWDNIRCRHLITPIDFASHCLIIAGDKIRWRYQCIVMPLHEFSPPPGTFPLDARRCATHLISFLSPPMAKH